jgi:hypothetical protein
MGGELSIDTEFIEWFKGYGPLPVVGTCPHDCQHRNLANIAWGPDLDHYTLDECRDCGCRAWIPVIRNPKNPTKPLALCDRARWMEVRY